MNRELESLLAINAKEVDAEITNLLSEEFDLDWFNSIFGNSKWEYDFSSCTEAIAKPVLELLKRGGKRWRPLLMKLSYSAVGGEKEEEINKFLAIPELIHNGTLIIDDIEDNSDLRRGKPCIHKLFGTDIAINVGNTLYYLPLITLIKNKSIESKIKMEVYELINEEMIKISFGQGMDIYWHNNDCNVTENQYLQMCAFKTGTLARLSAKIGAILASGTKEQIETLGKFAESIGIAFQIEDDILNITNAKWGKTPGDDITEGKKSLIVIKTLELADKKDKERLQVILRLQTKDENLILEAIEILKKYNSIEYSKKVAEDIIQMAWSGLDKVIPDSDAKNKLKIFADFMVDREI